MIIGKERWQIRPKRGARCSRQRRKVDDQLWLVFPRLGDCIGKHQASFGIGVVDLDGQSAARLENVSGPERIARNGIFRRRDQQMKAHRQPRFHDQLGQAQRMCSSAHILLHQAHRSAGLDIKAARIEADPLADDGNAGIGWITPFDFNQARGVMLVRCATDGVDHGIADFQIMSLGDGECRIMLFRQLFRFALQIRWSHIGGGCVYQIANKCCRFGKAHGFGNRCGICTEQNALRDWLSLREIAVKPVMREEPAEH